MAKPEELMPDAELDSLLKLSHLEIEAEDRATLKNQAGSIIAYFGILDRFKASSIEADRAAAVPPESLRADSAEPGLEVHEVKSFATNWLDGYFGVPKIIEGGE